MLASGISGGLKALWILGRNDNNKKLEFEASARVVHKRITSQNMPIWVHKRSSSVILSQAICPKRCKNVSVYLTLQRNHGCESGDYNKTVAIQKCGNYPYELSLRFAGCCLRCGACFAAGYSWGDMFLKNKRVRANISLDRVLKDFNDIPTPPSGSYNWMRILGGEPLLNDEYIEFLFDFIIEASRINSAKFNNGIVIQTNGIHIGRGNTKLLEKKFQDLYAANPNVIVAIETSIKGTNPEEFKLLTQSDENLFQYNIESYYKLRNLKLPNLRAVIIAGYGISESFLLTNGRNPKSKITILFDKDTPTYHPTLWSDDFRKLYNDFISDWKRFDQMFNKMPMYGIKDQFEYGWVRPAIDRARKKYNWRWYDSKYSTQKNSLVEQKFNDIIDKFFLKDNQEYYSTLIRNINGTSPNSE
jgi:uncharacterized Fe-S cluster-containing radical SAM superfamily protein